MADAQRALITGGAGFIGSHLTELLLADGWEVYALDDLSTGSQQNVAHLRDRRDYHLVVDSVLSNPAVVSELVHRCDVVFHLAAAVGVRLIVEQPVRTLVTNIQGTETVLEYCNRFGRRVLVASTSEVYGDHREEKPLDENARRVYGPTTAEALGVRRLEGDRRVPRARLPPGARARLRDRAAVQHRRPAPERPVRDGHPALRAERALRHAARDPRRRDADPLVLPRRGHVRALKELMDDRSINGEIFNVGSTDRITILELAERIKELTGSQSENVFVPYDQVYGQGIEDTLHREPAIEKIGAAIGWAPTRNLEDILRDVIEHSRRAPVLPEAEPVTAAP